MFKKIRFEGSWCFEPESKKRNFTVNEQVSQTRLDFQERQEFVSAKAEELRIVIQALAVGVRARNVEGR